MPYDTNLDNRRWYQTSFTVHPYNHNTQPTPNTMSGNKENIQYTLKHITDPEVALLVDKTIGQMPDDFLITQANLVSGMSRFITHGSHANTFADVDKTLVVYVNADHMAFLSYWLPTSEANYTKQEILGIVHANDVGCLNRSQGHTAFTLRSSIETYDPQQHSLFLDTQTGSIYSKDELVEVTITGEYCASRYAPEHSIVGLTNDFYEEGTTAHRRDSVLTDTGFIYIRDVVTCTITDNQYHKYQDGLVHTNGQGWVDTEHDDVVLLEDTLTYCHIDYAHWCDEDGCYYSEDYFLNQRRRQRINDYHCGIVPEHKIKTDSTTDCLSDYTIGFEVEKTDIEGETSGSIDEQPLFSHWENDSSCGVEGITHVYSLDNYDAFSIDAASSHYLDEDTSRECGGHINFAHRQHRLEMWHIKPWMGLMWSLWRYRLKNSYSCRNKKVNPYNGRDHHYGCLVQKGQLSAPRFELRLPSAVTSTECILSRFKLMQGLISCIDDYINERFDKFACANYHDNFQGFPNIMFTSYKLNKQERHDLESKLEFYEEVIRQVPTPSFNRVRYLINKTFPVIQGFYKNNPLKLARVIYLAYLFQWYIDSPNSQSYVPQFADIDEFIQ